jgi:hypothetical protein
MIIWTDRGFPTLLELRIYRSQDCKLVLMEVEYSNTSSGWKYLDHLKFVFNNIGLDHLMKNEININTFKRFCVFFCKEKKNSTALIKRAVLNFSKIFVHFKVNNRTCQMW